MKRNIFLFSLFVIIYRLLLDVIYLKQITPFFGYWMMYDNRTPSSLIISIIVLALFSFITYKSFRNEAEKSAVPALIISFIFLLKLVPFTSFIYYNPQCTSFLVQESIMWVFLFILLNIGKPITFSIIPKTETIVYFVAVISSLAVIYVSGVYAHFRLHLSLADVYDLRMESRNFNMPTLLKYVYSAASNLIPICIVFFMLKKNRALVLFLIFVGLLNFSIAGSKSTLFKIILCVGLLYTNRLDFRRVLFPIIGVVVLVSVLEFSVFNTNTISTLLIRRMFYIPNLLDSVYYDYMNTKSPLFFHTGGFTDIQFNIGSDYFNQDTMRANNGFFSDAYVNMGWLGCLVYPIIYSYLFRALDGASQGLNQSIVIYAVFLVITTLESTFITTSLLTHGLFVLIVVLYMIPRESNIYYEGITHM